MLNIQILTSGQVEPLEVILKVFSNRAFSLKEKEVLFKWAVSETKLGRRKRTDLFKSWLPAVVSVLTSVINSITN